MQVNRIQGISFGHMIPAQNLKNKTLSFNGADIPPDHQRLNFALEAMAARNMAGVVNSSKSVDKSSFNREEILNRKVKQSVWAKYPKRMSANEIFDMTDYPLMYKFTASVIKHADDPKYTIVVAEKYIEKFDVYLQKLLNGEAIDDTVSTNKMARKGVLMRKCQMLAKIGRAYSQLGDKEKAKEYFEIVQDFYPGDRTAAIGMDEITS